MYVHLIPLDLLITRLINKLCPPSSRRLQHRAILQLDPLARHHDEKHPAWLVSAVLPIVIDALLHDKLSGANRLLLAAIQPQDNLAGSRG